MASAAGGKTYGVAKAATLISVKIYAPVANCEDLIYSDNARAGIDWVANPANHVHPAAALMAFAFDRGASPSLEASVRNLISHGVTAVAAAGNNDRNACDFAPAYMDTVLTVGATNSTDARWIGFLEGSNYGTCLDLFAPGVDITTAGPGSDTEPATWTGTSQAAAQALGVAALFLGRHDSLPRRVHDRVIGVASNVTIGNAGAGSPNRLLYSRFVEVNYFGGPTKVKPNEECLWWVNPAGGVPPYTYYWTVNGGFVGSSSEVSYTNFGSGFFIQVRVTDSNSMSVTRGRSVTVSSSAPTCLFFLASE